MAVDPVLVRRLADEAGYLPTTLEKVARLEDLLREIARDPRLGEHLALKGGTAINFVLLPEAPRLSVDIDLNYLGEVGREEMLADRPSRRRWSGSSVPRDTGISCRGAACQGRAFWRPDT